MVLYHGLQVPSALFVCLLVPQLPLSGPGSQFVFPALRLGCSLMAVS